MTLVMRDLTLPDATAATDRFVRDPITELVRLAALGTKDWFSRRIAASNVVRAQHFICRMRSLMPTKDSPNQITALTASAIMFEVISMIAENTAIKSRVAK